MTVSETKLLPCPFCGPGNSTVDPWFDDVSKRWAVGCGRCGSSSGRSVHAEGSKEAAIKSWNTRGLTAALSDQVVVPRPVTISDTAEDIARSFAQYCLEHDILTMHGMKGLRDRVEVIIANFKQRIDDLENTIDLADKHTAFLMTKLDPPASTAGEV